MFHIGMDMHKKLSRVEVMDEESQAIDQRVLFHHDQEKIKEYFSQIGQDGTVTLEATRNWYWLFELLEEEGLRIKPAHPAKARLMAEARIKTDSIDASTLAQLERTRYLPETYIPSRDVRDNRELLRYRLSLVRTRTSLKNPPHAILDRLGINHPFSDLFGKKGREFLRALFLRDVYRKELDVYLSTFEFLDEILKGITKRIQTSLEKDPQAELLMNIPGISYLTPHLFLCEIGEIQGFPSAKRLCSYAGIVPGTHQSARGRGKSMRRGVIFACLLTKSARRAADHLAQEYGDRCPEASRHLEEGLEDSLQFYGFPAIDAKKISSTNMPERATREVRRRSRVVGVFPTVDSCVRPETCYLMEYSEDWRTERSYIKREKIQGAMERNRGFLTGKAASLRGL